MLLSIRLYASQRSLQCTPALHEQHKVTATQQTERADSQLRQPYLREILRHEFEKYLNVDRVTLYGRHLGNYQMLKKDRILNLCAILNAL